MTTTSTRSTATVACPFCGTLNRVDMERVADRPKCGNCGKPILLDRPNAISDATFDQVTRDTTVPVVSRVTWSKVASDIALGRSRRIGFPQLPHFGRSATRSMSTRFSVPQNGHATVAVERVLVVVILRPQFADCSVKTYTAYL